MEPFSFKLFLSNQHTPISLKATVVIDVKQKIMFAFVHKLLLNFKVLNPQIDNHKKREEEEDGGIIPQFVSAVCKCSQAWVSAMTSRVTGAGIALGLVAVLLWRATN